MVHFKNQDYKEILYPVHTLKMGVDIFDSFPKLLDYEEFGVRLPASLPLDKVFKYIVYTYDQKSPFVRQIDDLIQRKKEAIQEAGYKMAMTIDQQPQTTEIMKVDWKKCTNYRQRLENYHNTLTVRIKDYIKPPLLEHKLREVEKKEK